MSNTIGFNTSASTYNTVVLSNDLEESDFYGIMAEDAKSILLGIEVGAYWIDEESEWQPTQELKSFLQDCANPDTKAIHEFDRAFIAEFGSKRVDIDDRERAVQWCWEFFERQGWKNAQPNLNGYMQSTDTHFGLGWIDESCDIFGEPDDRSFA